MFVNIIKYGDIVIYNNSLRRFAIGTLFLIVAIMLYKFPDNLTNVSDESNNDFVKVYLGDKNNFVSLVNVECNDNIDKIKEVFECINNQEVPEGFFTYIPEGVKLINYTLDNNLLKLNFSKEFLNVELENENKLIEMIIYSFTNIKGIDKIMIFVENELLTRLPESKKKLPIILDRDYGINKVVDIDSLSNNVSFNVYYLGKNDNKYYYIPVTYVINNNDDVVEMIVRKLKSTGINSSLLTRLTSNVEIVGYNFNDGKMDILFNSELENIMKDSMLEEEINYMLVMSFADSLNINEENIAINFQKH